MIKAMASKSLFISFSLKNTQNYLWKNHLMSTNTNTQIQNSSTDKPKHVHTLQEIQASIYQEVMIYQKNSLGLPESLSE